MEISTANCLEVQRLSSVAGSPRSGMAVGCNDLLGMRLPEFASRPDQNRTR